jgi:8-oxo-dGTP pyrophosphatase MutT (NUDIX family)
MLRKIAAVIIENRKFLVVRDSGQDFFKMPGGKVESNESDEECLKRELMEELSVIPTETEFIGSAIGVTPKGENIDVAFCITNCKGAYSKEDKIAETVLIDSSHEKDGIKVAKTIDDYLIPRLLELDLID